MWNVVVVDNDTKSVEVLKNLLEAYDRSYQVVKVFASAEEAYKYLYENPIQTDLVITDICIPGLSGLELIEKVRDLGLDIKCIVMSNYKVFEYAQRAMELNVSRYLLKPLEADVFCEALDSFDFKNRKELGDAGINLVRAISYLKSEIEGKYKNFDMNEVAARLGYSKEYLYRAFKQEIGVSVAEYLQETRLREAKRCLAENGACKIYEVSAMVGYGDQVYFSKLFKKKYRVSPKEFQDMSNMKEKHTRN